MRDLTQKEIDNAPKWATHAAVALMDGIPPKEQVIYAKREGGPWITQHDTTQMFAVNHPQLIFKELKSDLINEHPPKADNKHDVIANQKTRLEECYKELEEMKLKHKVDDQFERWNNRSKNWKDLSKEHNVPVDITNSADRSVDLINCRDLAKLRIIKVESSEES